MLYSVGKCVICNISQFADEIKGVLILIDEHYRES
jgi:RNA polymerase subunit RPABC4/transcription elongation factor Spt4